MKRVYLSSILFLFICLFFTQQATAQNRPVYADLSNDEQLSFVGMMMADLIERYGSPRTVIVERGNEIWQDDVVFQYNGADFYIYRDRIWQVKLASTHGVSNGDRKAVVLLTLGNRAINMGNYILMPITGRDWPLMLRVNFDNINSSESTDSNAQVTAIYIYRPDY
ncbi:MAG: hypothetical protein FWC21_01165 [Treponema sp.]|nr:hypothetical protein [Treponema sp.]